VAGPRHLLGSRTALLGGLGVLLAAGVALGIFFAVHGGSRGNGPAASSGTPSVSPSPIPHFTFNLASVRVMPTGTKKGVKHAAHTAAMGIRSTLDTVYATGFIDPRAWRGGHYGEAWRAFTKDAIARARTDEPTLTLGTRAGTVFSAVMPHAGRLQVRILLDPKGHPSTAVADVGFSARADERSGHVIVIRSSGHYFLRPRANGWAIYGYEVNRDDGPFMQTSPGASQP
jgi:hypothetical protein